MNTQLMQGERKPPFVQPDQPVPVQRYSARQIMICLAACMALQMTSFVIILPLFSRRFTEFGAGVAALGTSEMAYALAATLAAPFMGALADRIGRKPLVLGSLAVYVLAFTGYLFAASAPAFIVLRGAAGALTAGLFPAATGMVADVAPVERRAQWIGILSGGASIGWILGPILGGMLYDRWGYAVALLVAIGMGLVALVVALVGVPETHSQRRGSRRTEHHAAAGQPHFQASLRALRASLPSALGPLVMLLAIFFTVMFTWAFIEPRLMFYAYDDLGWSSSMLGLVMSTYGVAMMLGEFGLGRLSDKLGRKPVIVLGLALFSAQFLGLAISRNYVFIAVAFVIAGLGNALYDPALSASLLDIAPPEHQARLLGLRSTVGSLGNIAGPALVVLLASTVQARTVFLAAAAIVLAMLLVTLMARGRTQPLRQALES